MMRGGEMNESERSALLTDVQVMPFIQQRGL